MISYAIDSSAIMAYLKAEPYRPELEHWLSAGVLTHVNAAETVTAMSRQGLDLSMLRLVLTQSGLQTAPITEEVAILAGLIDPKIVRGGLSLGDRCCLAYARVNAVPIVTGDRIWSEIADPLGVEILQIRD